MQKSFMNQETLFGRLYQHNLELKTVQNKESSNYGKEFISGTIDIATDEEGLNVIPVHFTYVVEITSTGKKNVTFTTLKSIIDGAKTWIVDGKDAALKLRVNTALGLNDFYNQQGELVSVKRNEGGFVNVIKDLPEDESQRSTFKFDIVITSAVRVETEGQDDYVRVKGAIFNFRKDLLPVELICRREDGMNYFESLDASPSNPIYTNVWGDIVNNTIKREIAEESAFGTATVKTVSSTVREWRIQAAKPVEYDFGAEDTITAEELKTMMQNREVYLAEIKKRADDYKAQKVAGGKVETSTPVSEGAFNF